MNPLPRMMQDAMGSNGGDEMADWIVIDLVVIGLTVLGVFSDFMVKRSQRIHSAKDTTGIDTPR